MAYWRSSTYCLLDGVACVTTEPDHVPILLDVQHPRPWLLPALHAEQPLAATRSRRRLKWGIWNAFKLILNGAISLFRLVRAIMRERMVAQAVRPQDRRRVATNSRC